MYEGRLVVCDEPDHIKSLVAGELLELRPSNLRQAEAIVANVEGVLEVQTYGDLLHLFVDKAEARYGPIRSALEASGIAVRSLRQTRPRMEEAFISLVRRQMVETGTGLPEVDA